MAVRWSRANAIDDIEERIRRLGTDALKSVDSDLEHLARESAQEMQQYIASRGTAKSGKTGRIESEEMINDVSYRKIPATSPKVHLWEFGWVETWYKYFKYQEEGFNHVGGSSVPGMFALKDASTTARDRIKELGPLILQKAAAIVKGRH